MDTTKEVLARMATAYELGASLDGTVLSITFQHEDGESVIGIPAEALPGFVEQLQKVDAQLKRQRAQ